MSDVKRKNDSPRSVPLSGKQKIEPDYQSKHRPTKPGKFPVAEMSKPLPTLDYPAKQGQPRSGKSAVTEVSRPATTKSGKLPVAEPASFSTFFIVLVMHVCKRILIIDTTKLVWFYICSVTVLSLLTDLFPFPKSYFSDKSNIWNLYFVKIGWGWTLVLLAPLMYVTSYVLCLGKIKIVYRHLARLFVATACWFIVTSVVSIIEHQTGACSKKSQEYSSKYACVKSGGLWEPWIEISGHCFLLVLCILTIAEEATVFRDWALLNELLRKEDHKLVSKLNANEFKILRQLYTDYTPIIRCVVVVLAILQVLWNVMLLSTVLYFHNMPDKLMGVVLAALGWFFSYKVLYKNGKSVPVPIILGKNPNFRHLKHE